MLVLMDRDGVLNEDRDDHIKSPGELVMIDGSAEAVADLNAAGHKVVLITNQSAVGRGIISQEMLDRIHDVLRDELARAGGRLDDIFFCTDAPGAATERRKPGAGMLREALSRYRAVAGETPMIGDSLRDLRAAASAGCRRILVRTGNGAATQAEGLPEDVLPVAVYENLRGAVDALLDGER